METKTQRGYLILADISGFTSYLAQVELDHAHEILAELLEKIVAQFKPVLTISKLEGDAVFAYVAETQFARGETLLELFEAAYLVFRDAIAASTRRTTCPCRACQAIPQLDLKFFVHFGEFVVQTVAGIRELVGSDVNLAHRLMKNHVTEATGWTAYALFTQAALDRLGLEPEGLHAQTETYEHLGEAQTYSLNLRPRYEVLVEARRVLVTPEEAHLVTARDYPQPPPVVWEWINDAQKRALWAPQPGYIFKPALTPGGRTGKGAQIHCVHGQKLFMVETVLDWRPFDYVTVDMDFQGMPMFERVTSRLTPTPEGGTRLEVLEWGRTTGWEALDRRLYHFMLTQLNPTDRLLENLARRMAEAEGDAQAA